MNPIPLKFSEQPIIEKDPWCDDKLNRKVCAERLTQMLLNQANPLTVALNGRWGCGKTYLLKRWKQDLLNKGYIAIYFNAWEDDALNDPLVAILAQLWQVFDCKKYGCLSGFIDTKNLISQALDNVIKITTCGRLDIKTGEFIRENKSKESKILDKYLSGNESKMILLDNLNKLVQTVYDSLAGKPLVFIVDELDRCRPTFAIETMERIKHIFCIDHVIFVLGIDREQLGHSIRSVYGNIDVENYLHRFIDLDLMVPVPDVADFFDWHMNGGINTFIAGLSKNEADKWRDFLSNLKDLVCSHSFSLREIEHFIVVMRWMLNINMGQLQYAILSAALVILKISNPAMYLQYIDQTIPPKDLVDFLIPENSHMEEEYSLLLACMVYFSYLPAKAEDDDDFQSKISQILNDIKNNSPISNREHCARCILNAEQQGIMARGFSYQYQNWLWNSARRNKINVNTIKTLTGQLEMDYLVKPRI